jgi:transposase-like protein
MHGSHLSIGTFIKFLYFWCRDNVSEDEIRFQLDISSSTTISNFKKKIRLIAEHHFFTNPVRLGGPNVVVQIDESLVVRRKYEVGRVVSQQWILGLCVPRTREICVIPVPNRTTETLLALISEYVLPGSIIITDCWASYNRLSNYGFTHLTVNHSQNFVDPESGATTNNIESVWQKLKLAHKKRYGTHRSVLSSYMFEFMWRYKYGKDFGFLI